jgi:hypothetical protein
MNLVITEEEIREQRAMDAHRARHLFFAQLVNAAHQIKYEISDGESFVFDFCRLARPQLHKLGIQTGQAWNDQVLLALARAGGPIHFTMGSGPDPARLTKSLIKAVAEECRRRGDRWQEGEQELERREALKGIHGIVWQLRDRGFLAMPPELRIKDTLPRFP